ncbi:hypothetical protein [Citrobacter braakii]|uniref:hypothetical protein n=1 Tax=Citrobacter braakii TaxID=57706 RepID=UPI00190727BA|nr:hypothetical protein [Citrobacter braakii]MBJ9048892.1 hypothetical protein [Citrobacter braakii]
MKIIPIGESFDDLYIRKGVSNSEHQNFWQKILAFDGYPEYGIRLSSSVDDYITSSFCISNEENEALDSYVADSWGYINKYLTKNNSSYSIRHLERKNILSDIISKMPLSELDFYRAVRTNGRCFFDPLIYKLNEGLINTGAVMTNNTFLSFTSNPYSLRAFSSDTIQGNVENNCIIYKLSGGVKSISKISPVDEFEGIIPPNNLFEVKHARKLNIKIQSGQERNVWLIEMEKAQISSIPHCDFYGNFV